jgi:hypothetical protein
MAAAVGRMQLLKLVQSPWLPMNGAVKSLGGVLSVADSTGQKRWNSKSAQLAKVSPTTPVDRREEWMERDTFERWIINY